MTSASWHGSSGNIFTRGLWWPAERTEWLEYLRSGEGLSSGVISRRMGLTRNAVIGKLHRMGLIGQPPKPPPHYPFDDFLDQEKESGHRCCRWPFGHPDEPEFSFCGAPVEVLDRPYCAAHLAMAYERPLINQASSASPARYCDRYRTRRL